MRPSRAYAFVIGTRSDPPRFCMFPSVAKQEGGNSFELPPACSPPA